ncbi:hypothetical protein EWM64_g3223 [Hericium alpestre]|uniref:DhaK domain-containing protein n=1 Tax=Hericium alpestre TaxID=135208 RepID=A0A4Z0A387_9AGAM|nr:hypothetical protein EWM64_g3223 [Hericium alpestre]
MGIQTKHFLNSSSVLVTESLEGLCTINPQVKLDAEQKVVYLAEPDRSKVAIICGGGAGHEPAHAGYVGKYIHAFHATYHVTCFKYRQWHAEWMKELHSDVLNFGLAKEQFAAEHAEKSDRVRFLVVGDDVAVGRSQGAIVGRRGLAGTVLVYKIAGALARTGASLDDVYKTAEYVANHTATIGVGSEHCHVPGTAASDSQLGNNEIEIGMGIHNEPGAKRISPVPSLHDLIQQLLDLLMSTTDPERSFLPLTGKVDELVLMVNNLGGLSELELGAIVREVEKSLESRQVRVQRVLSGTFMTSLNMPGFSITLLLLPSKSVPGPPADLLLRLIDAPTAAPGWKWSSGAPPALVAAVQGDPAPAAKATAPVHAAHTIKLRAQDPSAFNAAVERACRAIDQAEPEITHMDNIAGDGDCGLTLQSGAHGTPYPRVSAPY